MLALMILAKILKRSSEKSANLLRTLRLSGFAPLVKPNYATPGCLTQKQACMASGIYENTLSAWRKEYPELEPQMEIAREEARKKALKGIKTAGEKDWRALAEWLKLTFPVSIREQH
jgi:hypothetical protein